MKLYIASIITSMLLNYIANARIKNYVLNKTNNITYKEIGKYDITNLKKSLKGTLLGVVFNFIPIINLAIASLSLYGSFKEDILEKLIDNRIHDFGIDKLLKIYEQQKVLEEVAKVDGLTEEEFVQEMSLANKENGIRYINENVYNDIKASSDAITFLSEFEMHGDIELEPKERIKLIKEFKKAFVSDSKETIKPIEKTLKIASRTK